MEKDVKDRDISPHCPVKKCQINVKKFKLSEAAKTFFQCMNSEQKTVEGSAAAGTEQRVGSSSNLDKVPAGLEDGLESCGKIQPGAELGTHLLEEHRVDMATSQAGSSQQDHVQFRSHRQAILL